MRKLLLLTLASILVGIPLFGQNPINQERIVFPGPLVKAGTDCSEGVRYDDGTFESAYKFNSSVVTTGSYAMAFDVPPGSPGVASVCLCWVKSSLADETAIAYTIKIWASDGPGGGPGTVLGTSIATAQNLGTVGSFYRAEVNLPISGTRVWIGPEWHPSAAPLTYLCADESGATVRPGFRSENTGTPNENLSSVFPNYRALGVRAVFAPAGSCVPSDTALCLNKNRFKVEATFTAPNQPQGTAHVVQLTDETGYLWFFSPTNVEAVIKVLDACSYNQRFWVYAGGLTNVQVTLKVTDTQNGTVKTYTNQQGKAFQPVQDTAAFATCQ